MQRIIAIVLMGLILLGTFKDAAIFISFKINQSYIAKNLCVEREIAESTCKGCCQLKIKLNETRQNEKDSAQSPEKKLTVEMLFFQNMQRFIIVLNSKRQIKHSSYCYASFAYQFIGYCFHPPRSL